jgi:small GTP-binding protein
MSDLDIIRQIELILSCQLSLVDKLQWDSKGFVLNKDQRVTEIGLYECGIDSLDRIIQPLDALNSLQTLWLDYNQISNISPLASLKSLQSLSMDGNQISDISSLASLKSLQALWLVGNQISDISPLASLKSLQTLDLDINQISDLAPLKSLDSLETLLLTDNQISDISPLTALQSLQSLSVKHNPIKSLPKTITELDMEIRWSDEFTSSGFITFYNNPLESPPPGIVAQGKEAVRQYFRSIEDARSKGEALVPLQEIKVHLIGDGLAGKTSLLKNLIGKKFDPKESQTHGLNVVTRQTPQIRGLEQDNELKECLFHFWDFGGQEIMHASHQFFMTSRSVYMLVLDSRTDSHQHYWLRHIEKYGGKSPVIVVMNKIDENPNYNIEQNKINKQFPAIENRFHRISCKNGEGVESIAKSLKSAVLHEHSIYGTPFAPSWIAVKNKLVKETGAQRYLSRTRFEEICNDSGVTDPGARKTLLGYLNYLGIVLYFEALDLSDIYVLDPHWVTIGVYKIINSTKTKNGHLNIKDLDFILNEEKLCNDEYDPAKKNNFTYIPAEERYLLDIMKQFELCYDEGNGSFIIPSNLPKEIDNESEITEGEPLRFIMKYDYLPSTIIPRLMIAMQHEILDGMQWRYGMVLQSKDLEEALAKVVADTKDSTITIEIQGEPRRKREYFSIIRHEIKKINTNFTNLEVKEFIPLPGYPDELVEYLELLGLEKMGIDEYVSGKLGKVFSVSTMLDSVISREERNEERNKENRMGDIKFIVENKLENIGNPTVSTHQQNHQQVEVNVSQEIVQHVQNLQGVFENLKEDILREAELEIDDAKERKRLASELDLAENAIIEMETAVADGKKELKPSVKERLGEFIDNLSNPDSRLRKGIGLVTKGAEKAAKLADFYNKCAPFFNLASIPSGIFGA